MPTYQYQCTECGEGLEAVQKFTDDALTVCPSCDGRLKKVFSAVGIVFKGSGFYRNDSRGSSSSSTPASKPASTATASAPAASSSSSTSSSSSSASASSSSGSSSSGGSTSAA
ncbi:FmdB family zinc ribbon protein [Streptomyces sp. NPDC002138]|uniref:FmdB family zinc ribbon protein n=1 Tax=Streptomyces sp. NPDC002138 TaxID=3154410 RepID=UPI00332FC3A2